VTAPTPESFLVVARALCHDGDRILERRWQRAAAIVTRAALELALDEFWRNRARGVADSFAMRSKMLCLPTYLGDPQQAHAAYQVWASLSGACHRHAYDLEPTIDELLGWIEAVDDLRVRLQSAA
jgi:hypothetical protein